MANSYIPRTQKLQTLMREGGGDGVAVISSNPYRTRSHDQSFPYRPNSDLLYLGGWEDPGVTVIISSKNKSVVFAPPVDPIMVVWEGKHADPKRLAKALDAEFVISKNIARDALAKVRGHQRLWIQSIPGTPSHEIGIQVLSMGSGERRGYPLTITELTAITAKLRLFKDASELEQIVMAGELTAVAIESILPLIEPGTTEREIAATLEYLYRLHGAEPAFGSIVATGVSAATLHYSKLSRTLRRGDLLLIDTGAELPSRYSADISRTIPVGAALTPAQRTACEAVRSAQEAAIKKARPGIALTDMLHAAATELTHGLVDLRILRGKVSKLVADKAYKPYFPHGIGHSLGLDVHDISQHREDPTNLIAAGMVLTVEPGLYFPKKTGPLDPCGIRIEDDIVITTRGAKLLTRAIEVPN
jgi:Xaa-Pro aminopeptidase